MTTPDLTSDEGLRAATTEVMGPQSWRTTETGWAKELAETFTWVRAADLEHRFDRAFQERLWEDNHIAAVGQGNISVAGALDDETFRRWFAESSLRRLPDKYEERVAFLTELYWGIRDRLKPYVARTPHLKIFRVIAALYPEAMTTVADRGALHRTAQLLGWTGKPEPVAQHLWIRRKLDGALGSAGDTPEALARRIALPWILYDRFALNATATESGQGAATRKPPDVTASGLVPLPAARRRRGLTAIKGLFPSVLSTLEFIGSDGATRQELLDFLLASSPEAKEASMRMTLNVLRSELDVLQREDDRYLLTERGAAVLNAGSAEPLADWLVTRILGFDRALVDLRDGGPLSTPELAAAIRDTNPGLSTNFVPHAMIGWLRSFGVIERSEQGEHDLTETGERWGALVTWEPESLPKDDVGGPAPSEAVGPIAVPELASIIGHVQAAGHFPSELIAKLHASVWAHRRRHFAILTGLSGSGKTLLAREYARAIAGGVDSRVLTLPVQPGWYDPGALLGFTNPLRSESYVSTAFLEFLLEAGSDPDRAYVVVLDEMNLSHPEQYMAPLLSTMETGGTIQLHTEGDALDGVPATIAYPSNLVLIGTVNMDETTHGLSDKILDRAFVLEFWEVNLDAYPRWGTRALASGDEARARELLGALMSALSPARLHFGWRVVDDVLDFLERAEPERDALSFEAALDSVVYGKILPKLRGEDAPRFRAALSACVEVLTRFGLRDSHAKVQELARDLESTGSARFWR